MEYAAGIAGIILVLAVVAFYMDAAREADRAAAFADTSTQPTAPPLAQGWLVQFRTGGSRWLPCLAVSTSKTPMIAFALFPTPHEAARYRDSRIASEADRRKLVGDTGLAPVSIFRIVRGRLECA